MKKSTLIFGILLPALLGIAYLEAVSAYAATVTTFATVGSTPIALAFDSSGNLYTANFYGNSISKITPSGSVSTITVGSEPIGLAFGSSGNLYAVRIDGQGSGSDAVIVKITPAGATSTFATFSYPGASALAFDSSGNLYVAFYYSQIGSYVYKITPSGSVSTFATLPSSSSPVALAFDSSGNLYTANQGNNTVSKITSRGGVSTFATVGSGPRSLIFDSSGNLYVANGGSNTISKITPSGGVSTFATVGSNPFALAFDSSGNLYVAISGGDTVSEVTPSGTVSTLATVGSIPYALAFDSSGNLYVANGGSNTISEINLSPTCQVTLSPSSYNAPGSSTVSWTSTNIPQNDVFYIQWIGAVASSGSTPQSPNASQTYTGSIQTTGGSIVANCTYSPSASGGTLTVYPYCTFNSQTVQNGSSVTAYQSQTVPYGNSCASQTRTCSSGTLSGSYQYGSCAVNPPASCTLNGTTVQSGQSATFYQYQTAPEGQLCSAYQEQKSCTNGVLSPSDSTYIYGACGCQTYDICTGSNNDTITQINGDCSETNIQSCTSPYFCSQGSNSCLNSTPTYNPSGTLTGHLQLIPNIVHSGEKATVYWNIGNVQSCSVTGSNGDSWSGTSAPSGGNPTKVITGETTYTLSCTGYGGASVNEVQTVNVAPAFEEI